MVATFAIGVSTVVFAAAVFLPRIAVVMAVASVVASVGLATGGAAEVAAGVLDGAGAGGGVGVPEVQAARAVSSTRPETAGSVVRKMFPQ
ncbi:hypothetical protein GCM10010452_43500 [Crossiella cryophila]